MPPASRSVACTAAPCPRYCLRDLGDAVGVAGREKRIQGVLLSTQTVLQVIGLAISCVFFAPIDRGCSGPRYTAHCKPRAKFSRLFHLSARWSRYPGPANSSSMGSPESEIRRGSDEGPQHRVVIAQPFAIAKYEVTFAEWDACVAKGGCSHKPSDEGWGRDEHPVVNISWNDAVQFVKWLASSTGSGYRLQPRRNGNMPHVASPAPACPPSRSRLGATIGYKQANYDANFVYGLSKIGVYRQKTLDVGRCRAIRSASTTSRQRVGVGGGLLQAVTRGAPADGSAVSRATASCASAWWSLEPLSLDAPVCASLRFTPGDVRLNNVGLRVARPL